jgi:hypothetical protein
MPKLSSIRAMRQMPTRLPKLHVGLGGEVADLGRDRVAVLAPGVVVIVAVEQRVLGALLVVHHDVDDDARAVRPLHLRRVAAVADEVADRAGPRAERGRAQRGVSSRASKLPGDAR